MFFLCHKIKNDRTRHVSLGPTQIFENSARSVCVAGGMTTWISKPNRSSSAFSSQHPSSCLERDLVFLSSVWLRVTWVLL